MMRLGSLATVQSALFCVCILLASCSVSEENVDWPVHGGDDQERRFSVLDDIDTDNVGELGLAWSFEVDTRRGQEATPIVVDGVMYVSTAWSKVYAINARTGEELWSYDPEVDGEVGFTACCDVVNRGVAVAKGIVFLGALDGRLIALDATTGEERWSVQTTDPQKPYTITGAPRVFKNMVVIGNGGAEYGVRGYVTAYDIASGDEKWRFYTVPGNPADGPDGAASDQILAEKAEDTWFGDFWRLGAGGTAWDAIVYDPELDQLYVGVGNGSPWNHQIRSEGKGDNLFLSSIVALDPDTGKYLWHYQQTPGETWDFTATQPIILADLNIKGTSRKVLMQAPKNGFFYVIDRTDGRLISAENFVPVNWATSIDTKTGRPVENPKARYTDGSFIMQPSGVGGHSWHPMAFSPETGLVYIPSYHFAMGYGDDPDFKPKPGAWNTGVDYSLQQVPDDPDILRDAMKSTAGLLIAWDPVAQKERWSVEHASLQNGGVLATGGGLVFQGTGNGQFQARSARSGELLWKYDAPSGIIAGPITYALDGEQYVTIFAGYGGAFGIGASVDDPKNYPLGRVLTFRLGGTATALAVNDTPQPIVIPTEKFSDEQVDRGRLLYTETCYRCHGGGARSTGVLPDLRRSAALRDKAMWQAIVLDGALRDGGMISFERWLNVEQSEAIRAYVSRKARIDAQDRHEAAGG